MEIHNPLNSTEVLSPKKLQDKQDSKKAYPVNGFWYLLIYLFVTLFNVGTLKIFIANKNQPQRKQKQ